MWKSNAEEAADIERELKKLHERASQMSSRTIRETRHSWNRISSNISSACVGCREILSRPEAK